MILGGASAFAAITEAGERGLSTAIVNTELPLGGTCVNVGCVPSKHLLAVAHDTFEPPRTPFNAVQYSDGEPAFNWETAINEKDELVDAVREANYYDVADYYGADVYEGYGRFVDDTTIEIVDGEDEGTRVTGEKTMVATGSSPIVPPIDGINKMDYETSETILDRRDQPDSVVMIGAGYIGLEWGQILNHLGTDVTILEMMERPLPNMEEMIGRKIREVFKEEGVEIVTDAMVTRVGSTDELAADGGVEAVEEGVFAEAEVDGET